jgi:predicted alpha/beta hydrolase
MSEQMVSAKGMKIWKRLSRNGAFFVIDVQMGSGDSASAKLKTPILEIRCTFSGF